jgi:signal transduction histidine kinase
MAQRPDRERDLLVQIERLREMDRFKTNLMNAASHELRTPLTSISGYAEFLDEELAGPLTPDQRRYVAQIRAGTRRLEHIVADLLDYVRLEAGTFKLIRQRSNLHGLLIQELESMRPQAQEAGVHLLAAFPDEPWELPLDPSRIGQVIRNLLANALKFTPRGGMVTLSTALREGAVRVAVRDTGIGIAPEFQPNLFTPFYQADQDVRQLHGGTGLGLSISKALIEAHQGQIGVESSTDEGSTFWFTLPLDPVP